MTDIPDIQKKTTPDNTGNQKPELYGVGGWLLFFWDKSGIFWPALHCRYAISVFRYARTDLSRSWKLSGMGKHEMVFLGHDNLLHHAFMDCRLFFELSLQMVIGASCHIDTLGDRTSANSACHILSRHEFWEPFQKLFIRWMFLGRCQIINYYAFMDVVSVEIWTGEKHVCQKRSCQGIAHLFRDNTYFWPWRIWRDSRSRSHSGQTSKKCRSRKVLTPAKSPYWKWPKRLRHKWRERTALTAITHR